MTRYLVAILLVAALAGVAFAEEDMAPASSCSGTLISIHTMDHGWIQYCGADYAYIPSDNPKILRIKVLNTSPTMQIDLPLANFQFVTISPITAPYTKK